MRKCTSLFIALFFILFIAPDSWGGKIIYPWRTSTAIVKVGESFDIWFVADDGQTVNAIELTGPHNDVIPAGFSTVTGNWTYDEWSGNTYNTKITVNVPVDAPADRYDVKLKTSGGDEISRAAVKIIKEYRDSYYILHMSDAHRWQGIREDTENIMHHEVSAVINAANIIDPIVFIDTGDFHYPNTNYPDVTEQRIQEFMCGNSSVKGLNEVNAAVFMIPGNHDTNEKDYNKEKNQHGDPEYLKVVAEWYNKTYGLTTMNFSYGNTRFIGINNGWSPRTGGGHPDFVPNYGWQLDRSVDWINQEGKGNFRVAFIHKPQESVPATYKAFYNADAELDLILAGHIHRANENPMSVNGFDVFKVYTTNTARGGNWRAPFNLYKVNNITGTYEPVGNSGAANEALAKTRDYNSDKLTLGFSDLTDGQSMSATINNNFNFEIEGAFARFVMPKGYDYIITSGNGYIEQQFEGRNNHIVDVKMNVPAFSVGTITLSPAGTLSATDINSLPNVSIYPNPAYDDVVSVEVSLKTLSRVSLSVLDMNGSVVLKPVSIHAFEPGTHKLDIPLINILPGKYFLQITFDGIMQTHKLVVM
jgi:calcineurin-like phosphoesterase family protein